MDDQRDIVSGMIETDPPDEPAHPESGLPDITKKEADSADPLAPPPVTEGASESPPEEPPSDAKQIELVRRALSGSNKAKQALCEALLPLFQRVAALLVFRFRTVTRETARQEEMDILHHIVLAFMEELQDAEGVVSRWRFEQGPLEAWLRPFATCRGLDYLRRRRDGKSMSFDAMTEAIQLDLLHLHSTMANGQVDVEHGEALRKLCDAVLKEPTLGPEALQLLERLFWTEEDRELVARSLGLRRNTLDVRIKRIRQSLLKLSEQFGLAFGSSGIRKAAKG